MGPGGWTAADRRQSSGKARSMRASERAPMDRIARHAWLLLLLLVVPSAAQAARPPAVKRVAAPQAAVTGARVAVRVQLRRPASRPARLSVLLSSDKRRSARDVKAGSVRVARGAKTARATIAIQVRPGRYYL